MDIYSLQKKKNIFIENPGKVLEGNYKTFYVLNPDGILDSVAGLEHLSFTSHSISYRNIICYQCLHIFYCENSTIFRTCPKCKVVNAIVPYDKVGLKVIIVICYKCNSRNIANIDTSYVRCYFCNSVNYSLYNNISVNRDIPIIQQEKKKKKKKNPCSSLNMFKCMKLVRNRRKSTESDKSSSDDYEEELTGRESGGAAVGERETGRDSHDSDLNLRNDREEKYYDQRMDKKQFNEENIFGYAPDGKYSSNDFRKSFGKTSNGVYNPSRDNISSYGSEKYHNDYMRNVSHGYNQMGHMTKSSNDGSYKPMNNNKDYNRISYSKEHKSFYNEQSDKTYKPAYNQHSANDNSWIRDSKWHGDDGRSHGNSSSNNYKDYEHKVDRYNEKIGALVESGNVKRKTHMFNNIGDSNSKKVVKTLSLLEMDKKRDSDVKSCIEYFNSLRKGSNTDIKTILENKNFKELNIPKEHLENGDFYKYVEYYKKHNLKDLVDCVYDINSADKKSLVNCVDSKGKTTISSFNNLNKDSREKGGECTNQLNTSNSKTDDSRSKKKKRSESDSHDDNCDEDGKIYHKKKKSKCEMDKTPTFYTINDLFA
ncbi:conserved Plasmodium protein, unknown function [Plasmodium ovale curtisi]|uniref:Uncharacterized protein n=2 Tax=Plasmodium ovale curtisi TaxID=864141 RepID=A0A1A8WYV0_PLAOA|nr:conserved Plasmodium protein, unknown function [Plasmodium ovale curtisi]